MDPTSLEKKELLLKAAEIAEKATQNITSPKLLAEIIEVTYQKMLQLAQKS